MTPKWSRFCSADISKWRGSPAITRRINAQKDSLSFNTRVERGEQPGAGFEVDRDGRRRNGNDFLSSIASARHEAHTLFELSPGSWQLSQPG